MFMQQCALPLMWSASPRVKCRSRRDHAVHVMHVHLYCNLGLFDLNFASNYRHVIILRTFQWCYTGSGPTALHIIIHTSYYKRRNTQISVCQTMGVHIYMHILTELWLQIASHSRGPPRGREFVWYLHRRRARRAVVRLYIRSLPQYTRLVNVYECWLWLKYMKNMKSKGYLHDINSIFQRELRKPFYHAIVLTNQKAEISASGRQPLGAKAEISAPWQAKS